MASLKPDKFIPNSNSTDADWEQWHRSLRSYLGRKQANGVFTKAWDLRGGVNVKGNTRKLRDYLQEQGLSIGTNGMQDIVDFGDDIGDSIGNFVNMAKWGAILTFAVGLGGLAVIAISVARKPERIMLATPAGRAVSLAGGK